MFNLFLFITLFFPIDWITALDIQIDTINQNAVLKRTKHTENEGERVETSLYKWEKQEKLEIISGGRFTDSMIVQYYSENTFVYASRSFWIADYIHKGKHYPERAEGEMTEIREYYRNEQEGIQLRRTLDYFPGTNRDSLHLELLKEPYDTLFLTNADYVKNVTAVKRFRKRL